MTYTSGLPIKWAIAFNNTAGLTALNPQPNWNPGEYAKWNYGLSGGVNVQGRYYGLMFDPGLDESIWFSVLSQFGLSIKTPTYNVKGTVQIPWEEDGTTNNFNCVARYGQQNARHFGLFWKTSVLLVAMVQI